MRIRNPLPTGSASVAVGLGVLGASSYGFLVLSARALGPERYAPLSALWALVFFVGPGVFLPFEQEVARAVASRRAQGPDVAVFRRAVLLALGTALVLTVAAVALRGPLLDRLLDGQSLLVLGLALSLGGFAAEFVVRGSLSAHGWFGPYSALLGSEGLVRLVGCVGLVVVGVETAGPFAIALGAAPGAAALIGFWPRRTELLEPGTPVPWDELSRALGYLLAGSLLSQVLINAGPLAVKVLAEPDEQERASQFLAALVVARVPLFLFQAIQASLLPRLATLVGHRRHDELRAGLRRLAALVGGLAAGATVAAFVVGPAVVRLAFGPEFALGRRDLAVLAASSGAYMLTVVMAQALIALAAHRLTVLGWGVGVAACLVAMVPARPVLARVEDALLLGSLLTLATMVVALLVTLHSVEDDPGDLAGPFGEAPFPPTP